LIPNFERLSPFDGALPWQVGQVETSYPSHASAELDVELHASASLLDGSLALPLRARPWRLDNPEPAQVGHASRRVIFRRITPPPEAVQNGNIDLVFEIGARFRTLVSPPPRPGQNILEKISRNPPPPAEAFFPARYASNRSEKSKPPKSNARRRAG